MPRWVKRPAGERQATGEFVELAVAGRGRHRLKPTKTPGVTTCASATDGDGNDSAALCPLFATPTWANAQVLLMGTLLTQGPRTVTAALRTMGLGQERCFERYLSGAESRALVRSARRPDPAGAVDRLGAAHLTLVVGSDLRGTTLHLGMETQRQRSALAIARTTLALLGL